MAWYDEDSWLTWALAPSPMAILVTVAFALLMPIVLHSILYRNAATSTGLPTFLLVGPSGAGKTALTMLVSCSLLVARCALLALTVCFLHLAARCRSVHALNHSCTRLQLHDAAAAPTHRLFMLT